MTSEAPMSERNVKMGLCRLANPFSHVTCVPDCAVFCITRPFVSWTTRRALLTLRRFGVLTIPIVAMALLLGGCRTERVVTSDGRPMPPKAVAPPTTPAGSQINRMAFMVGSKPEDTTGNGYPDLIRVTVALFSEPHPIAIHADGAFEFVLYAGGDASRADAEPLARWRKEGEAVRRARGLTGFGESYHFNLSLAEAGGDVYPLTSADMRCIFHPADGSAPVRSEGVRSIQIGRRVAGR
jgi:hypothetical protein